MPGTSNRSLEFDGKKFATELTDASGAQSRGVTVTVAHDGTGWYAKNVV